MPLKKKLTRAVSRVAARAASRSARRMVGGGSGAVVHQQLSSSGGAGVCPPGVWCMDTGMIIFLVLALVVFGYIAYSIFTTQQQQQQPTAFPTPPPPTVVVVEKPVMDSIHQADPRWNPLSPERSYTAPPDVRGFPTPPLPAGIGAIPINQATRGVPDQYQQVGVLTAPGGSETSASPSRTILPLFGRKLITNRDRWNYYTRTDGINPVQVPVEFKRRKCDDDTGCEEVMDGDSISVPILGQSYVASVYRYATPRYIPF